MNWTSTQYTAWTDQCHEFATRNQPFRLDHVYGQMEKHFCAEICEKHDYKQLSVGSSVSFVPNSK